MSPAWGSFFIRATRGRIPSNQALPPKADIGRPIASVFACPFMSRRPGEAVAGEQHSATRRPLGSAEFPIAPTVATCLAIGRILARRKKIVPYGTGPETKGLRLEAVE
jgi:hypothetical protein